MSDRLGGIEFGGTKTVCVIGSRGSVDSEKRFPTGDDPALTLGRCASFFAAHGGIAALGIGAFGPCDPDPDSPTFGTITTTPKPGWAHTDVVGGLRGHLGEIPIGFDTDVNAAALGELDHGAGRGVDSLVYVTVGTGIGGGLVIDRRLVHGLVHPEMGHLLVRRPAGETAPGVCPFHGDCWEGVASGPAIAARWGSPAQEIGEADDRFRRMWDLEAGYVAGALHTIACVVSPQRIILGGGVGQRPELISRVRPLLQSSLAGYIASPAITAGIESYVVPPGLGDRSGSIGALELANRAAALT